MRRRALVWTFGIGVTALACCWVGTIQFLAQSASVYSVSEVTTLLRHNPGSWLGRSVRVSGYVPPFELPSGCTTPGPASCGEPTYVLIDVPSTRQEGQGQPQSRDTVSLLLRPGSGDPLYAALRHIPLLSHYVPDAQRVRFGAAFTYTLRLAEMASATSGCVATACYFGLLQDAVYPRQHMVKALGGI